MRQLIKEIQWQEPLSLANKIAQNYDGDWIFLYSGLNSEIKNSKSIIALDKKDELRPQNLSELKKILASKNKDYGNACFGYVSYEYKNKLENFAQNQENSYINSDEIFFAKFSLIFEFDHEKKSLKAFYESEDELEAVLKFKNLNIKSDEVRVAKIFSNFSSEQYLLAIEDIKSEIAAGNFYQTNLTRKFFGKVNELSNFSYFKIFEELCEKSSANFSSFLKIDNKHIISSSPELFFESTNGKVTSRPIKGTVARGLNQESERKNKEYLLNNQKEKAENLMIVDLVRNDLSRICNPSSVKVDKLFELSSYKTLHHLSSEISGNINEKYDAIDAFDALFPAGSMTGAPKIAAIKKAMELEKANRGIYSGAIGYFKNLQDSIFSVVIRTLIFENDKFEFQVGGAITHDSNAQKELEETFVKAKGICSVLKINLE